MSLIYKVKLTLNLLSKPRLLSLQDYKKVAMKIYRDQNLVYLLGLNGETNMAQLKLTRQRIVRENIVS